MTINPSTNRIKRRILMVGLLAVVGAALAGCGSSSKSNGSASTGATEASGATGITTVVVDMNEFSFKLDKTTIPAGEVKFTATNSGKVRHEMVVIRSDKQAAQLGKAGEKTGEASEQGSVGEIGDFGPGKFATTTMTLKPGHYALICNIPGHYKAGMYSDLIVK